ncbi:hypothetical protein QQS21_006952 [Conoideocrella luteorostrata]|uniref:Mid2 domain-containing protein n=1 Tax=Conoideocrella luteorostrata TaxID=1105319 RepID=A0AAJ0CMI9_9HYPO|nr:hypothetical protein QQS21_006952 [Conoideocrella luteorostrata]
MQLICSIVVLCAFIANAVAKTSFIQPPSSGPDGNYQDNPHYRAWQDINIQWESDLASMSVMIFQQYPPGDNGTLFYNQVKDNYRSNSMNWSATFAKQSLKILKAGEAAVLYFAVAPTGSQTIDGRSHYFNVTADDTAATSIATTATTTSTATTDTTHADDVSSFETRAIAGSNVTGTSTNTQMSQTASASAGATPNAGSGSGLSGGAYAGIAVAGTVVGILLLGGLGFFARKKSRKRNAEPTTKVQPVEVKPGELSGRAIYEAPAGRSYAPVYEAP